MKFSVLQENVKNTLAKLAIAVPIKPTLNVLSSILIRTDGQRIVFSATTLELAGVFQVGGKVDVDGSAVVDFKVLKEFVDVCSPERMDFEIENNRLHIRCGGKAMDIKLTDVDEYPPFPTIPTDVLPYTFEIDTFKRIITQVYNSAASDDNRPVLQHICFTFKEDGSFDIAAANGYRLDVHFGTVQTENTESAVYKPHAGNLLKIVKNFNKGVTKTFGYEDYEVKLYFERTRCFVVLRHEYYILNLHEGTFPDYMVIVPTVSTTKVQLYVQHLLDGIKGVQYAAKGSANAVKFIFKTANEDGQISRLDIIARDMEKDVNASSIVDCYAEGQNLTISFNYQYMVEYLKNLKDEQVVLEFSGAGSPVLISPLHRRDENIHVIMPMSVGR